MQFTPAVTKAMELGYSLEDIRGVGTQWYSSQIEAGVAEEEARAALWDKFGLTAGVTIEDYDTAQYMSSVFFKSVEEGSNESRLNPNQPEKLANNVFTGLLTGYENSITGLTIRGENPEWRVPEDADISTKVGMAIGQSLGDLPAFVAAAAAIAPGASATGPAAPLVSAGGAGFVTGYVRQGLMNAYKEGKALTGSEWLSNISENFSRGITEGTMAAIGFGAPQVLHGPVSKAVQKLIPTAGLAQDATTAVAMASSEIAAMGTISAAQEGRLPKLEDFAVETAGLLGYKACSLYVPKLMDLYSTTAMLPQQVTRLAKTNPDFKDAFAAVNTKFNQKEAGPTISIFRPLTPEQAQARGLVDKDKMSTRLTDDEVTLTRRGAQQVGMGDGRIVDAADWTNQWVYEAEAPAEGQASKAADDMYGLNALTDPRLWVDEASFFMYNKDGATLINLEGNYDKVAVQLFEKFLESPEGKEYVLGEDPNYYAEGSKDLQALEGKLNKYAIPLAKGLLENPTENFIRWLRDTEFTNEEVRALTGVKKGNPLKGAGKVNWAGIRVKGQPGENRLYMFDTEYLRPSKRKLVSEVQADNLAIQKELDTILSVNETTGQTIRGMARRVMYQLVDRFRVLNAAAEPGKMSESYMAATLAQGAPGISWAWLNHGALAWKNKEFVGKPLFSSLEALGSIPNGRIEISRYLALKSMTEAHASGQKIPMKIEDVRKRVADYETNNQELVAVAKDITEYQKHLSQYAVDSGLITKASFDALRKIYKTSIPLDRLIESIGGDLADALRKENPVLDKPIGKQGTPESSVYLDPVESLIRQTFTVIRAAETNEAKRIIAQDFGRPVKVADAAGKTDVSFSYRSRGRVHHVVAPKEIVLAAQQLDTGSIESMNVAIKIGAAMTQVFRAGTVLSPTFTANSFIIDQVTALFQSRTGFVPFLTAFSGLGDVVKGSRLRFEAPELSKAEQVRKGELEADIARRKLEVEDLDLEISELQAKLAEVNELKKTKPKAVGVYEAEIANLKRRIKESTGYRDENSKALELDKNTLAEMTKMGIQENSYLEWLRFGGGAATLMSVSRRDVQRAIADASAVPFKNVIKDPVANYRSIMSVLNPLKTAKLGVQGLSGLAENAEQSTRVGEFTRAREKGYSVKEAAFLSRELTVDFARAGASMKAVNLICAFFNATVQGTSRVAETIKYRPEETAANAIKYLVLPSMMLAMVQQDIIANEPDSEMAMQLSERPEWRRATYWAIPVPNGENPFVLEIPKPHVWAASSTIPEAYVGWLAANGKTDFMGALSDMGMVNHITGLVPSMIPGPIRAGMESVSNYSMFTGSDIVPIHMQKLMAEKQYRPSTTASAKWLSKAFFNVTGADSTHEMARIMSPIGVEHIIRNLAGGAGIELLKLVDMAAAAAGLDTGPEKPAKTMADLPFFNRFVSRYPAAYSFSPDKFNTEARVQESRLATYKFLAKSLDPDDQEEARELLKSGPIGDYTRIRQALGTLSTYIQYINVLPSISAEEKRVMIDDAYIQMIRISKQGLEMVKQAEEAFNANQ